jgi:ArsR family transcriptional regulator
MNAEIKSVTLLHIWPNSKILDPMAKRSMFKQQARVLKALANESRLMIIDRLNRGECSVGELTELIGSDVSTVSKHLALLRANGFVEDRRQGTSVFYRLLTPCVCNFFACASQVLKEKSK